MQSDFYNSALYPLQDRVLAVLNDRTEFYLTGGTAVSRFHFQHRYSDDLDLFVNGSVNFRKQADEVIELIEKAFVDVKISMLDESFARVFLSDAETILKIELINDVPFHVGGFESNQLFHRIDNCRNILSNKITALNRLAVKDVSDIIEICKHLDFEWPSIIEDARKKDAWVNELGVLKLIGETNTDTLIHNVLWVNKQDKELLEHQIQTIASDIIKGEKNSLFQN